MKKENFTEYTNDELKNIRAGLIKSYGENVDTLPAPINKFIATENEFGVGNNTTRINRCIHLIDREIVHRFVNNLIK